MVSHRQLPRGFGDDSVLLRRPSRIGRIPSLLLLVLLASGGPTAVDAADPGGDDDAPSFFVDLARDPASGLVYARQPSPRKATLDEMLASGKLDLREDLPRLPGKPWGAPGVALLDYDGDGDLDLYVTNGPGAANSLFANQGPVDGTPRFREVAATAGVALEGHDSNGVCFGDLDNDGDPDLMVLGALSPNRLLRNRGDGTFEELGEAAGVGGGERTSVSCAMGDVDGDGLLDIAVANTYDWTSSLGLLIPFEHNQPNQLLRNRGDGTFEDISASSGFLRLEGLPPEVAASAGDPWAGGTWAIAMVDLDADGDVDILGLDNRGSPPAPGGAQHGLIHLHRNDGRGHFEDRTVEAGLNHASAWLGVAIADFDCDQRLDFFATNAGDYPPSFHPPGVEIEVGAFSSRWFLAGADGVYRRPNLGELGATVMGWGVAAPDLDNDGDADVVYHGGLYSGFFLDAGNPGVVLENPDCTARFAVHPATFGAGTDHRRRNVQGLATGDLDGDLRPDVVTVASFDIPPEVELVPNPHHLGSPFDASAAWVVTHRPGDTPGQLVGGDPGFVPGSLSVELNRIPAKGQAVGIRLLGTMGLLSNGHSNRDGIGAVITATRRGKSGTRGAATRHPVLAGSSHASQDALEILLGLGEAEAVDLEILWPGGRLGRLNDVRAGDRVHIPEIPCDAARQSDDATHDATQYEACVRHALGELLDRRLIDPALAPGLWQSAFDSPPPPFRPTPPDAAGTPDHDAPETKNHG